MNADRSIDSRAIGERQQRVQREELRGAVRALLMTPLMSPAHDAFSAVRRQAGELRDWFARETGWSLHVERDGARLYKRPADLGDGTRGLPGYGRRRYVLLCLACAVLERADPQITLQLLAEKIPELAADQDLAATGFAFTLESQHERRELVAVCRTLLDLGVLQRVAGDEDAFVAAGSTQADALYDVQRRVLAGMLAAVRGPSTWTPEEAPVELDERVHSLVHEHVADSDEARRTALRHGLARRLLDDPVIYLDSLDAETRAYFVNQRGIMAGRLCEATGLVSEQRAEGVALADDAGSLTDVAMPAEGTDAHATLLVAEFLATRMRRPKGGSAAPTPLGGVSEQDVVSFVDGARQRYGRYWRKSAREPGGERELAAIAIDRLEKLKLVDRTAAGLIRPRPALARFAVGEAEIRDKREPIQARLL